MVGADVGSRALAADVLLTRRQRQGESAIAVRVAGLPDQAPGHLAQMRVARRHESEPGSAELQRESEALALAGSDIDSEIARSFQQTEREALRSGRNRERAGLMRDV